MGVGWLLLMAVALLRGLWLLHGYLGTGSNFPQPLSSEEEQTALIAMEAGDRAARDRLIEHNLRLVAHLVKKFEGSGENPDDLISIGTVGLIKGVETFNRHRGTRLATYAARCIENEILMHLRTMRKGGNVVSLAEPISRDPDGNEVTLLDILPDEGERVEDRVARRQQDARLLQVIASRLGGRERQVLRLRYGFGGSERRTQREIARLLNISRSYVSRIEMPSVYPTIAFPLEAQAIPRRQRPGRPTAEAPERLA